MAFISDAVHEQQVRKAVAADLPLEDTFSAIGKANARAAKVKAALAAAKKRYPDGIPASVRGQIFKNPDKFLSGDSGGDSNTG